MPEEKEKGQMDELLGGTGWKDPDRYQNLLHIAGSLGVPGAAEADAINQQVHPADLIIGILGHLHKKTKKK